MGGSEKGKLVAPKTEKGKLGTPKGKQENGGKHVCDPLGNEAARETARTHDATRNDFLVGLSPQPPIFSWIFLPRFGLDSEYR